MKDLGGKVAVVTGAGSGIGKGLASRFAGEGMKVVLADVQDDALEAVEKELAGDGAEVLAVRTDVSKAEQVDALAERTLERFGAVHVVCNNAGVATGGLSWQLPPEDWAWVLGVNLWGVIHGVRAFVPHLVEQGEGHVVNTASMAGVTSAPGLAPYNVSKHGVVTLSETLHRELEMSGSAVKVSVLCPGWVSTAITDSARNRPADLDPGQGPNPLFETLRGVMDQALSEGMDPLAVADLVLDAIDSERFYVFTHPEWKPMIEQRMQEIMRDQSPGFTAFPM